MPLATAAARKPRGAVMPLAASGAGGSSGAALNA